VNLPETREQQEETQGVMVTMTPSKQIYVGERSVEGDDAADRDRAPRRARDGEAEGRDPRRRPPGRARRGRPRARLAKEAGASGFALASE
jgi:hypothetical protein